MLTGVFVRYQRENRKSTKFTNNPKTRLDLVITSVGRVGTLRRHGDEGRDASRRSAPRDAGTSCVNLDPGFWRPKTRAPND
jgi:hypothetical protein